MDYRLKLVWNFSGGNRLRYLGAIVAVFFANSFSLILPLITSYTVDFVLKDEPNGLPHWLVNLLDSFGGRTNLVNNLWMCGLTLVIAMSLYGLFVYLRSRLANVATEATIRKMRNRIYDHLQRLPYDYHVKAETGDLIQRCTTDVETIRRFISGQLVEVASIICMMTIALTVLSRINTGLMLLSLLIVPVILIVSFIFFKNVQKRYAVVELTDGKLSTIMQENFTGVRVVRAFGREAYEREKFLAVSGDLREKNINLGLLYAAFWGGTDLLIMMQMMLSTVVGVYIAAKGQMTVGNLLVFTSYTGMMLWPIRNLGRLLGDMGKMVIAAGRINDILAQEEETSGDNPLKPDLSGDIVFRDVHFSYNEGEEEILKGLSFTVKAGETVAILGATGSGKSTIMHLLQRLYEYNSGSITVSGVELKNIDKHHLRSRVGIVLQEPFMYSKSIRENIAITQPDIDDAKVFHAARSACIHDVVTQFEQGYDTIVGERGVTLSGGQKQRVAIACTLLRDNQILIFDDSLSAVDTQTDAAIRSSLRKSSKDITTFIISHRVSTLMEADKILVIENGHLIQCGSHAQLIQEDGLYQRIWKIQSAIETEEKVVI